MCPQKAYSPYKDVRKEVIANDIRTTKEYWANYKELETNAPSRPYDVYPEWKSWTSFFGSTEMDSFEEVKAAVKDARLLSQSQYKKAYRTLPCKAPACPNSYYADEWVDWFDFLGKDRKIGFHPLPHLKALPLKIFTKSMLVVVQACHYKTGELSMHTVVIQSKSELDSVRIAFDTVQVDLDEPHNMTIKNIVEVDKVTVCNRAVNPVPF